MKLAEFAGLGAAFELGREALHGLGDALKEGFETADKIEAAEIALTGLAGSADNAKAIISQLKDLTGGSTFSFDDLTAASRKLLGVGVAADQIEPLLKNIGDVATGTGASITEIADAFVKVAAEGSVNARELKSLGAQGIPIVAELAKRFSTTAEGIKQMAENGQIGFDDLRAAFASLSGPGGKFAGLMDKQANTVDGLFKRLKSTLSFDLADIADQIEESFNFRGALQAVMGILPTITNYIRNGVAIIGPYVQQVGAWIWHGLGEVWELVRGPLTDTVNFIIGVLPQMSGLVGEAMSYLWGVVQNVWGSIWGFIGPIVAAIYDTIATHWEAIVESTVGLVNSVFNAIEGLYTAFYGTAKALWDDVVAIWNWACGLITGQTNDTTDANRTAFESMYDGVKWYVDGLKDLLNAAAYTLNHFQDAADIVGLSIILSFVQLGNQIEYTLTEVIPYAVKFGIAAFRDLGAYIGIAAANMVANLVAVVTNLPDLLKGKTTLAKIWTPLTEGFESEVSKLPALAERVPGELEKALEGDIDEKAQKFAEGLGNYLNAQDEKAKAAAKKITGAIKAGLDNVKNPKPLPIPIKDDKPKITPYINPDNLSLSITPEIKQAKLLKFGSAAAQLAVFGAPPIPGNPGIAGMKGTKGVPTLPGVPGAVPAAPAVAALPNALPHPATPAAVPPPQPPAAKPGTGAADDPASVIAAALTIIKQYIVKWDTNPPLAAVNM